VLTVLLGAVVTYLVAPSIQDRFEHNRWKRQHAFELGRATELAATDFLVELAKLQAHLATFDSLMGSATGEVDGRLKPESFQLRYLESYAAWRQQTARVSGTLTMFEQFAPIQKELGEYTKAVELFLEEGRNKALAGDRPGWQSARMALPGINMRYKSLVKECQADLYRTRIQLKEAIQ
jgi:hypothetical protein